MNKRGRKLLLKSSDGTPGMPTETNEIIISKKRKPYTNILNDIHIIRVETYQSLKNIIESEINDCYELSSQTKIIIDNWDYSKWPLNVGPLQIIIHDNESKSILFNFMGKIIDIIIKNFKYDTTYKIYKNKYNNPEAVIKYMIEYNNNGKKYNIEINIDIIVYVDTDIHYLNKTGDAIISANTQQNN